MMRVPLSLAAALILSWSCAALPAAAPPAQADQAKAIIQQYLNMPLTDEDGSGVERLARLKVLDQLKDLDGAVDAIAAALPKARPEQQRELLEALRRFPSKRSADILIPFLKYDDERIRFEAVHQLRMFAARVSRVGPERKQRGLIHEPAVEGLVPHFIVAAGDKSEHIRIAALYALADTLEPAAVKELRNRLADEDEQVRMFAACLLTEYQDASGLQELRKALPRLPERMRKRFYSDAVMVLCSLERITTKSFGPIPMDPGLMSDTRQAELAEKRLGELTRAWEQWWAWEPQARQ